VITLVDQVHQRGPQADHVIQRLKYDDPTGGRGLAELVETFAIAILQKKYEHEGFCWRGELATEKVAASVARRELLNSCNKVHTRGDIMKHWDLFSETVS